MSLKWEIARVYLTWVYPTPNRPGLVYSPCSWQQRHQARDIPEAGNREETTNQQVTSSPPEAGSYKKSGARRPLVFKEETEAKRCLRAEKALLHTSGLKTSDLVTGLRFESD